MTPSHQKDSRQPWEKLDDDLEENTFAATEQQAVEINRAKSIGGNLSKNNGLAEETRQNPIGAKQDDDIALLSLLADIRKAAGDADGRLMQSELVAHITALRADAERYQWLKPHFRVMSPDMGGQHRYSPTGPIARMRGPTLDAAIDAVRAAK